MNNISNDLILILQQYPLEHQVQTTVLIIFSNCTVHNVHTYTALSFILKRQKQQNLHHHHQSAAKFISIYCWVVANALLFTFQGGSIVGNGHLLTAVLLPGNLYDDWQVVSASWHTLLVHRYSNFKRTCFRTRVDLFLFETGVVVVVVECRFEDFENISNGGCCGTNHVRWVPHLLRKRGTKVQEAIFLFEECTSHNFLNIDECSIAWILGRE